MDYDDDLLGRVLTRREALALLGASGLFVLTGCRDKGGSPRAPAANAPCVVRPEQTEGPYFVDEMLNRSDIRRDPSDGTERPGTPLRLAFQVSRIADGTCTPLEGALVHVWHCDALGVYSDVRDPNFDTRGQKFLRGYQATGPDGVARFTTLYPGWYHGRTVHVHFKIGSAPSAGRDFVFTSQLYFDDALTDHVHSAPPYAAKGRRSVLNADDGIYADGGDALLLATRPDDAGYAATFDVALDIG